MHESKLARRASEAEAAVKAEAEAAAKRRKEIERRMHPRTAADFEVLYNELEAWRHQETRRINAAGLPEKERLAQLAKLLHKARRAARRGCGARS